MIEPPLNEPGLQPKTRSPHVINTTKHHIYTHNNTSNSVFIFYAVTYLIILVENGERPFILRFGSELKIFNVLGDDLSVCDEEPLKKTETNKLVRPTHTLKTD